MALRLVRGHDPATPEALDLLDHAGFTYDARLGVWFNLARGRAIGDTTVRGHSVTWLAGWVAGGEATPDPAVARERVGTEWVAGWLHARGR